MLLNLSGVRIPSSNASSNFTCLPEEDEKILSVRKLLEFEWMKPYSICWDGGNPDNLTSSRIAFSPCFKVA
jgi:hypothetical protein